MMAVGSGGQAEALGVHCSPIGIIPKKDKAGRWRLILDLSSPTGGSVNDGTSPELSKLSCTSVDDVMQRVLELCRHAQPHEPVELIHHAVLVYGQDWSKAGACFSKCRANH